MNPARRGGWRFVERVLVPLIREAGVVLAGVRQLRRYNQP
jgi:hypothetical protein